MVGNSKATKCESSFPVAGANDTNQAVQRGKNGAVRSHALPPDGNIIIPLQRVIEACPETTVCIVAMG